MVGSVEADDVRRPPDRRVAPYVRLASPVTADGRGCCVVETTYVWTAEGRSAPWPEHLRAAVDAHLVEQHRG